MKSKLFRSLAMSSLIVGSFLSSGAAKAAPTLIAGVLSVGSDETLPPYTYLDNGKPAGFDADFVAKLASHMRTTPKFVDTRFANLILGVTGGRYDLVASGLYVTPERAKVVDFVPYFMTGGAVLGSASNGFSPKSLAELCGKRVATIKGGALVKSLNDVSKKSCEGTGKPAIAVREFDTSAEAAQAVLSGGVDVQYDDMAIAGMIAERSGGRLHITSNGPIDPVLCGLALKKGNTALKTAIESAISEMKSKGEYQEILGKYHLTEPTAADVANATGAAS
ncbi:ABC transporter substrate-binding protein [Paraburkholderia sp. MM6662-R1]|uniref:ABC transporter substrate-binding protein n=1 Tax=Paraburkholderia sp. MM6662-R1 TaxID=2991066 RepID=UPI003D1B4959